MISKAAVLFCSLVVISTFAAAAPVITSIEPDSGRVAGGATVFIRGAGFSASSSVLFGRTPAPSVRVIDAGTIEVRTPPHLPTTVDVIVQQEDGRTTAAQAFTFSGEPREAFEPILVPVFSPPVRGAFGSEFHTVVLAFNGSFDRPVAIFGHDTSCLPGAPATDPLVDPLLVPPRQTVQLSPACSTWPARVFYVRRGDESVVLRVSARVFDVSRTDRSYGTSIPIIYSLYPRSGSRVLTLLGVPVDRRFRNRLRIYSTARGMSPVSVRINDGWRQVWIQAGSTIFEPGYGEVGDFPPIDDLAVPNDGTIRVDVSVAGPVLGAPALWAFVTATNNETQEITTITPEWRLW